VTNAAAARLLPERSDAFEPRARLVRGAFLCATAAIVWSFGGVYVRLLDHFLFLGGAGILSAASIGMIGLLESICAPIWVWVAFETPSATVLIGGSVVLAAVAGNTLAPVAPTGRSP
jgi:hypothetical protein